MSKTTTENIDALSTRVLKSEMEIASMSAKVERASKDIQGLYKTSTEIRKSVDNAKWQILAMVSIPVIILTFKLFT